MELTMTQRVLAMDLDNLTQEQIDWLHELKTKATVLQNRIMMKHRKEEGIQ